MISRRTFLRAGALALGTGAGLLAGAYTYAEQVEATWLDIHELDVFLPRLPRAFEGFRLAHLSDIHLGDWMTLDWFIEITDKVNALRPDALAITGDLVTSRARQYAEALKQGFRQLAVPTFAVAGNHDHWSWIPVFHEAVRQGGLTDLSNRIYTLRRGAAALHLVGFDDIWMNKHRPDLVLPRLPPTGCAILLVHEPDYADTSAAFSRFDLQLSGHSHGGQVRLPALGALTLPPYGQKYPQGLYQVGTMQLYTNRGVGMVAPHVRLNCRPEISVYRLQVGG
jgi:predicted MPP superfamily phosphohydrolase